MSYTPTNFVFGEQPSAAKWNQLTGNDASFNDGTGIAALTIGGTTAVKNSYKFSVTGTATTLGSSATAIVVSTAETFDTGSNIALGIFTAPIAGFYSFIFTGILGASNGAVNNGQFFAYKNGSNIRVIGAWLSPAVTGSVGGSCPFFLQLAANDTVQPYGLASTGGASFTTAIFEGFLVSAT